MAMSVLGQTQPITVRLVTLSGLWLDVNKPVTSGHDLTLRSHLRVDKAKAGDFATLQFTSGPRTCSHDIRCDGAVCSKPISVQAIYLKLSTDCHAGGDVWSAIRTAFDRFTSGAAATDLALALTLSRGTDEESADPMLHESVLLLKDGHFDPSALFRSEASGSYWLEFCEAGARLSSECASTEERDRTAVHLASGKSKPIPFHKADGIYRARLWKMTPRGPQPTERSAVVLVGDSVTFEPAHKLFSQLDPELADLGESDPTLRLMLAAWLADTFEAVKR